MLKHTVFYGAGLMIVFIVLLGTAHAAESNRIETLSLEQALALAESHHPELTEARALVEAAGGRAQQAGAFPNPELIGRIEALPLDRHSGQEPDYLVGVSQALPLGGRLGKARQADRLDQARLHRAADLKWFELRKAVHSAFATALYQETAGKLQTTIATSLESVAGMARARVEQGDATPDELARAEMEVVRGRVELRRSQAFKEQAYVALAAAVGMPDLVVGSVTGSLETVLELATIESLAVDLGHSPAVAATQATIDEKRARIDLARAERIPDIKVEALYRRLESTEENAIDLGVAIPLPLFDRSQGRVRAAQAELAAAEARARATAGQTERRFRETQSQLAAALDQARALRTEILPRAETLKASMEKRYLAGDISLLEFMPASRDWAEVQLAYLETVREVLAAWTEVRALGGAL
ncbi:MAG: TolC family protein [Verrucomicrobia bacterium]|nr:TolC family protein [Verrucomicrobiota bacterium]